MYCNFMEPGGRKGGEREDEEKWRLLGRFLERFPVRVRSWGLTLANSGIWTYL